MDNYYADHYYMDHYYLNHYNMDHDSTLCFLRTAQMQANPILDGIISGYVDVMDSRNHFATADIYKKSLTSLIGRHKTSMSENMTLGRTFIREY